MKQRSLFFPLALIAAGILWILISMGRLPAQNLWALAHLWPFLLIGAGLSLILRSYWAPTRLVYSVLAMAAVVLAILYAQQLGWTSPDWSFGIITTFEGGATGSGKIVAQTREVSGIQAISLDYPAEVTIRQGAAEAVVVETDDNLQPQLSTRVDGGTLRITNSESAWNRRVNPTRPVRITITVKDLHQLDLSSAGLVHIEQLKTESLRVSLSGAGQLFVDQLNTPLLDCNLSGAGNFTASGLAGSLKLNISGVGGFDGKNLTDSSADVQMSGVGSATVHVTEQLTANVSGVGSVNYYGSPSVNEQVSGVGAVHQAGQ